MAESLTREQMAELDKQFGFVELNDDYISLARDKPFKDKCYYMLQAVDKLLPEFQCLTCSFDKIDEIIISL